MIKYDKRGLKIRTKINKKSKIYKLNKIYKQPVDFDEMIKLNCAQRICAGALL
jgi:hypothetical protein